MRLSRRFDHVVATTQFAANEFQRLGVTNLVRVPLGVDLETFHPCHRDESLRSTMLQDDEHLIVHCGRLSPEKKVERSIDTLVALRERGVPARLVVAGDGPSRSSLERRAHGQPVTFLGFVHERSDLARLLASADVVLAPGPLETFCLAALEALASGTPVVASASSAVREVLGVDAHPTPVGAVAHDHGELFADAVVQLLAVCETERRAAARLRAEQFPWSNTVNQMLALHDSVRHREVA
jgi:alpha-1,6-mannosyltransferase